MAEQQLLNVFLLASGTLAAFWLLKALKTVENAVFLLISLYFLSLFLLAKTGVISVHPEKLQQIYLTIHQWFSDFANWILQLFNNGHTV
jgi:uncharacterized membrane protein (Fun14 family)